MPLKLRRKREFGAAGRGILIAAIACAVLAVLAPAAPAVPPFAVAKSAGRWWFTTPAGRRFFSRGVCCVEPGENWKAYNPQKPGYAAWQDYPSAAAWAKTAVTRLPAWGFTTLGGWSDMTTLRQGGASPLPFTPELSLGASVGMPWLDMWDPKLIATMKAVAKAEIEPVRGDPNLLGYFSDNELGWWSGALWKFTLNQKPASGQRRRLIALLERTYRGDWHALEADFQPSGCHSFASLTNAGMLYLRPGSHGMAVIQQFLGMMASRYYSLMRDLIHQADPRGLYLGDRYQSFYYPEVARAARPYVDVISSNLNPSWSDGRFIRCYLDTLHQLAQKPVMVTEFYMTAAENRSGNKNSSSGFPVLKTQAERAIAFGHALRQMARLPYVVGADWFQYTDEPEFGRGDGENYDMGLVDIHDRPYRHLTRMSASINCNALHASAAPMADVSAGIPPAPADPMDLQQRLQALQSWNRVQGFVPPASRFPSADLYLCWSPNALYVGVYAIDILETDYYRNGRVPDADRPVLQLEVAGHKPIRVTIGAGRAAECATPGIRVSDLSGLQHNVRDVAVVRLPATFFGKGPLRAGEPIKLSVRYVAFARARFVTWRGSWMTAGPGGGN